MFDFDDSTSGGSVGPWISWKYKGTEDRLVERKSFAIRGKDANDASYTKQFDGFTKGVALDLESVQQGWVKDGGAGVAPERRWGVRERPDDSKKQSGSYAWSQAFSITVAIGGGEVATWEDASWGGYEGFRRLATAIKAAGDMTGKSPVVRFTGVEEKQSNNGKFGVPLFEIVQWIDKPAVFAKPSKMGFDDTPAEPTPQPAAAPAATPAPAPAPEASFDANDFG